MSTEASIEQSGIVETIREAVAAGHAIYPLGGGTAADFGLPPKMPGHELPTAGLDRVIDYPSRDMTITVEAGVTLQTLAELLATEGQRLPIDAADAERATLGGLVDTNFSGPRRYGCGTIRDYVIGVSAVDGRGTLFKAGGRVVKNVAGYDFCKLLTGSLGTLAVLTQVTLKLKPIPEADALLACRVSSFEQAERLLAALGTSATTPTAIELLVGQSAFLWPAETGVAELVVGFEGTRNEVDWMIETLTNEWYAQDVESVLVLDDPTLTPDVWQRLTALATGDDEAPLVVKANMRPSAVCGFIDTVKLAAPRCRIQAHAGSGAVVVVVDEVPAVGASKFVIQHLRPAAQHGGGHAVVWSSSADDLTRQVIWGPSPSGFAAMQAVKRQFDPQGLLNPGRYYFA